MVTGLLVVRFWSVGELFLKIWKVKLVTVLTIIGPTFFDGFYVLFKFQLTHVVRKISRSQYSFVKKCIPICRCPFLK